MDYDINGTNVFFPFKPYTLQEDYMDAVIRSCSNNQFAILESPTGTGKTLSLLCAVLSWKRKTGSTNKIVYSSRTHMQLSNVVRELKRTCFRPTTSIIASRTHFCLDEKIQKMEPSLQSKTCRDLRRDHKCQYFNDVKINNMANATLQMVLDLDEFVATCKHDDICPYMVSLVTMRTAEFILTPYTYIVDPSARSSLPRALFHQSVLIFDEAHNLPDQCCDMFSHKIFISQFYSVRSFFRQASTKVVAELASFGSASVEMVLKVMENICRELDGLKVSKTYQVIDAGFLYSLFIRGGIVKANLALFMRLLNVVADSPVLLGVPHHEHIAIDTLHQFMRALFPDNNMDPQYIDKTYTACITPDHSFNLLCFSASVGFRDILELKPKTIIMTSGTLAPLKSFAASFGTDFPIILENPHIAKKEQLFIAVASNGPSMAKFAFTFRNRSDQQMTNDLVKAVERIFDITPSGALLFFPSFSLLSLIGPQIKSNSKKIISEGRSTENWNGLSAYKESARDGAALLGVCRGKMSEGTDFSNEFSRFVGVVGVPFPNVSDFKVKLRKEYLDRQRPGLGDEWYVESAMRVVNQAIGRSIRNKDDYGAVVLFDERFGGFINMLPLWVRDNVKIMEWNSIETGIKEFFERREQDEKLISQKPESQKSDNYLSMFTTTQRNIIEGRPVKRSAVAAAALRKLPIESQKSIIRVLSTFRKNNDIEEFRMGLDGLEESAREVCMAMMSEKLKEVIKSI